jgi:hypothetical protein
MLAAPIAPTPAFAYDAAKFCKDGGNFVVILVDVTTAFDDRAKDLFQKGIAAIVGSLSPGDQVRISTIEDSYANSTQLYAGCVPYCESSIWDFFTSDCTEGLVRLESRRQLASIRSALQGRLEKATADLDTSDIIRAIHDDTVQRPADAHLELYVFSDLIENSEFMPGKVFWAQPTKQSIALVQKDNLMPDFSGSTVTAFGVGRGGSMGRHPLTQDRLNKLHEFWTAYFAAAGAPDAQITESLYLEN